MSDSADSNRRLYISLRNALIGGSVAAVVMAAIAVAVGQVGGGEAEVLLEATLPATRFFCSAVMTSSATTLALMLTLLGLSTSTEGRIKAEHYRRIQQIALLDVIAFIGATVLLLAHAVPFGEDIEVPPGWYGGIYYGIVGAAALLGGTLVTVMGMIYGAVRDIIGVVEPGGESRLVETREGKDAEDGSGQA